MSKTLYIINPAGSGGAGVKAWERLQLEWSTQINSEDVRFTERQGHAREIAASSEGYEILVAIGGDGTAGEILSGIMDNKVPRPKLSIIPAGTGNDIARNVGIFSFEDGIAALRGGHVKYYDLIRIDCHVDNRLVHRYAFLHGNVGFSSIPMVRPWMKRILGPKAAYYLGTFLQIIVYRPPHMTVRWEEQEYSGHVWIVVVGSVERISGGSMCIAPGARADDGELKISIIPSQSKFKMMTQMLPKVATGAHVDEPGVSYFPAKKIEVESDPPVILDVDGDIFGATPATFAICPHVAQVLSPKQVSI
jgi:diacylglycerol kinase (ATP)